MSTIPLTFNQLQVEKTVLGPSKDRTVVLNGLTCIVIKRTVNQYRNRVFRNLVSCGFEQIISIEIYNQNFNTPQLSADFPEVKFVCVHGDEKIKLSDELLLNIAMEDVVTPYALVVHDDFCIEDFRFNSQLAQKLIDFNIFCVCPRLLTKDRQGLPIRFTPKVNDFSFGVESSLTVIDQAVCLYPFDGAAFFNVNTFKMLGGFDYTISAPYWQKIDLFFRAWLWGEKVALSSAFSLTYFDEIPADDKTSDISYLKFYLKNLLPTFKNDHCELSTKFFWSFKSRSQCGTNEAIRLFSNAKHWVKENKYRFKMDAVGLLENWGKGEEE